VPRWPRRKPPPSDADIRWTEEIAPQIRAAKAERARRLVGQEDLVVRLERLLFERDPIGINFDSNTDEYRAEAETITLRLPEARTETDLLQIIHEGSCGGSVSPQQDRSLVTRGSLPRSG
jgi:hypothetical protein